MNIDEYATGTANVHLAPRPKPNRGKTIAKIVLAGVFAVLIFVLGIGIGGASALKGSAGDDAAPAPAPVVEVDTTQLEACQRVAQEMNAIALAQNDQVSQPYNDIVMILHGQMMAMLEQGTLALDVSEIDRATGILNQVNADIEALTARVEALGPENQLCAG